MKNKGFSYNHRKASDQKNQVLEVRQKHHHQGKVIQVRPIVTHSATRQENSKTKSSPARKPKNPRLRKVQGGSYKLKVLGTGYNAPQPALAITEFCNLHIFPGIYLYLFINRNVEI